MECTQRKESIARWTTPTILYKPKMFELADVAEVYLVVIQNDAVVIEKGPDESLREEDGFLWTLGQEDTAKLEAKKVATIKIDGTLNAGTRFTTHEKSFLISDSGIQEVI